jgi:hypothetical protein
VSIVSGLKRGGWLGHSVAVLRAGRRQANHRRSNGAERRTTGTWRSRSKCLIVSGVLALGGLGGLAAAAPAAHAACNPRYCTFYTFPVVTLAEQGDGPYCGTFTVNGDRFAGGDLVEVDLWLPVATAVLPRRRGCGLMTPEMGLSSTP